ncbi:hypothetical protein SAMN05421788_107344 [Filimonas lacunae]|uniref:Uncharacterized protein n=1 Tax=Filimonas lacunae TaxID=477680 RepID=A0A173MGG8_9BACT|nr:hypothetical protein [Filimonas lacunae]BAV06685.1 hypothetical protein FLA_2704 [Filimonas lacunae]SIT27902.1 hypothetical protein SAMN05421788_107344 [Filimonas lacunae]
MYTNMGELEQYDGENESELMSSPAYKEYAKAYKGLLQSLLNLRFSWEKDPEDFLALVLLTYKAITNVKPWSFTELTEEDIAHGIVLPDINIVAAVFEEWIRIDYGVYQNFQQLMQNAIPSDKIFNEELLVLAESKRNDFGAMLETSHGDGAHMIHSPLYDTPHPISKIWAEAFTAKLAKRIKLFDDSLCEILLGHAIYKGAYMVI